MKTIFADLHIHIGRTNTGKPVKITGSKGLTLESILEEASTRKGIEMVGVIDCHVPEVIAEIKQMIRQGKASPLPGGGIKYADTTLILGTEMEINDSNCQGPVHVLCFLPTLEEMAFFSSWMSKYQKNITLSSQRTYASAKECQNKVRELNGLFIPAHIFTPFKSVYGKGVKNSFAEIFDPELIDAVELGLSSDTAMADQLTELHSYSFLTNSDAHSVSKIAREYQQLGMEEVDFTHLGHVLKRTGDGRILANYGLNPKLGKYYKEVTARLEHLVGIQELKETSHANDPNNENPSSKTRLSADQRPPYIHQIPLEYIPKLGPKVYEQLLNVFGTEMNVIHRSTYEELTRWVRDEVAQMIIEARIGNLDIHSGGSGKYGKVGASSNS